MTPLVSSQDRMCMYCEVAESVVSICIGFHVDGTTNRKLLCSGCAWDATLKIAKRIQKLDTMLQNGIKLWEVFEHRHGDEINTLELLAIRTWSGETHRALEEKRK